MTTIAVEERWRFGGVDFSTYARLIRTVSNADDLPALRGDDLILPGVGGRFWVPKLPDYRRLALGIWVTSSNDAGGLDGGLTVIQQSRKNLDALKAILTYRGRQSLERIMPDASTRTAQAEVVSFAEFDDGVGLESMGGIADFQLADPWFYGTPVVVTQAISASPQAVSLVHPGTAPSRRIVLDFTGPIANPRVTNTTNGFYVECLVTVASGKHLLIDGAAFTALNDGVNAIGSIRHQGGYELLRIDPGTNALSVTSTSPGGSLTATFTPPFA